MRSLLIVLVGVLAPELGLAQTQPDWRQWTQQHPTYPGGIPAQRQQRPEAAIGSPSSPATVPAPAVPSDNHYQEERRVTRPFSFERGVYGPDNNYREERSYTRPFMFEPYGRSPSVPASTSRPTRTRSTQY